MTAGQKSRSRNRRAAHVFTGSPSKSIASTVREPAIGPLVVRFEGLGMERAERGVSLGRAFLCAERRIEAGPLFRLARLSTSRINTGTPKNAAAMAASSSNKTGISRCPSFVFPATHRYCAAHRSLLRFRPPRRTLRFALPVGIKDALVSRAPGWAAPIRHVVAAAGEHVDGGHRGARDHARVLVEGFRSERASLLPRAVHPAPDVRHELHVVTPLYLRSSIMGFQLAERCVPVLFEAHHPRAVRAGKALLVVGLKLCRIGFKPIHLGPLKIEEIGFRKPALLETGLRFSGANEGERNG